MSRPRRVSDEEVFLAVRQAVLEQGPHVSLDVVAERLGVTAPALFRRFGCRTEILLQALRPPEQPPFLPHIEAGPDDRPIEAQIADLCVRVSTYLQGVFPCMSALRESGIPIDQVHASYAEPPPLLILRALAAWFTRARAAGLLALSDGDEEHVALALLGAVQAPIFIRYIGKRTEPWDAAAYGRRLAQVFLHGLSPAKERSP